MEIQDSPDVVFNSGTLHHSSAESDKHAFGYIHVGEDRVDWNEMLVRGSSFERTTEGGVNLGREDFLGRVPLALDESSANAMSLAETFSPGASNDSARCSTGIEQCRNACAISNYLSSNEHPDNNQHLCGHSNREALKNVLQPMPELFDSVETTTSDLDDMPLLSNPEPAVQPAKQETTLSHSHTPRDVGLENIHLEAVSSIQPLQLRTVCDGERAESIICSSTEVLQTPRHRHRSSDFLPEHSGLPEYVQQVSLLSTLNDVRPVEPKQMAQTSVQMPGVLPTVLLTTPLVADNTSSGPTGKRFLHFWHQLYSYSFVVAEQSANR